MKKSGTRSWAARSAQGDASLRWALLGGVFCAGLLHASDAVAQVLRPVPPAVLEGGVIVSPFDNPVISAEIPMTTTPRPGQMSMAMDRASAWLYRGFGVWGEVACPAGDLLCEVASVTDRLPIGATRQPSGLFEVKFGETAFLDVHGSRLGTGTATLQLWQEIEQKQDGQSPTPKPVPSTLTSVSVRTTADTLIVPLNVVVVVPTSDQPEHDFMSRFADRRLMQALFDDGWSASTARFPDGPLEVQGKWDVRTSTPTTDATGRRIRTVETVGPGPSLPVSTVTGLGVMPDDIFVQCGIQFRLQQFLVIEEDDPEFVRRVGSTGPICSGLTESIKLHSRFREKYKDAFDRPELVTVVFNNLFDHPTCFVRTLGEFAANTNDIVMSTSSIASGNGPASMSRALAHELGHSLGLRHSACNTGPENDDLMCPGGSSSPHIFGCDSRDGSPLATAPFNCVPRGDMPGGNSGVSCDTARAGARKFITDTTPPVLDGGPDQTLECTSPSGASVTLNATASDPETGIQFVSWDGPNGQIENKASVTTTAPLGATTYTAKASNTRLMQSTDTVIVTVKDTTAPTVSGTTVVNTNGCATGGTITLPVPTATDACQATPTISGSVVQSDGVVLPTSIPVVNGAVALPPGVHVVSWVASDGTNSSAVFSQTVNVTACFASGQSMNIGDRSQMRTIQGGWAPIANHGSGALELNAGAAVGSITSVGAVALRGSSKVNGFVTSAARVDKDPPSQVTGAIRPFANVSLPPLPTITNPWPPSNSQQVVLEPDQRGSITPGTYKLVSVASRATLTMAPGTYYIEDLRVLEPQSLVRLSGATTIEVKSRFVHRGAFRNAGGASAPVAVRYRGTEQVFLDTTFFGSVLAPNATVTLGGTTNLTFRGQFIAKRLEVRPDLVITTEALAGGAIALNRESSPTDLAKVSLSADESDAPPAISEAAADDSGGCSMGGTSTSVAWPSAILLLGLARLRRRAARHGACEEK